MSVVTDTTNHENGRRGDWTGVIFIEMTVGWSLLCALHLKDYGAVMTNWYKSITASGPKSLKWTGSNWGLSLRCTRQGGFETRPYRVIASLPFNTRMLNH